MKEMSKKIKILSWICFVLFPVILPISLLYFLMLNIFIAIKDACDRISELIISGDAFNIKKIRENMSDGDHYS